MRPFMKIFTIVVLIGFLAFILYVAVAFIGAILPQNFKPDEARNESIKIEEGGRYLWMEIYTGHSALNADGVFFKEKNNQLVVRPTYCLLGMPVSLCHPKANLEYINRPITDTFRLVKVKLPEKPDDVILKFRGGKTREIAQKKVIN